MASTTSCASSVALRHTTASGRRCVSIATRTADLLRGSIFKRTAVIPTLSTVHVRTSSGNCKARNCLQNIRNDISPRLDRNPRTMPIICTQYFGLIVSRKPWWNQLDPCRLYRQWVLFSFRSVLLQTRWWFGYRATNFKEILLIQLVGIVPDGSVLFNYHARDSSPFNYRNSQVEHQYASLLQNMVDVCSNSSCSTSAVPVNAAVMLKSRLFAV